MGRNGNDKTAVNISISLKDTSIHEIGRPVAITRVVGPEFDVFYKGYFRADVIEAERRMDVRTRAQRLTSRVMRSGSGEDDPMG